jgi:hypothetical protein
MYIGVHLFYLGGVGGRRLSVAVTGIGSFFGAREERVIGGDLASVERPAPEPPSATEPASQSAAEPGRQSPGEPGANEPEASVHKA